MGTSNCVATSLPQAEEPMTSRSFSLSVLVPVYNERHLIESSLRRLLTLRHALISEMEIIVVDDASTDGTREILEKISREDDRIRLLRHERNQGKGGAVRTAIKAATGQ